MNIYYRVTQVDAQGTTFYFYELEIPFQSYYITVYFATSHPPHKRLAKYRPFSYFMIFPGDDLEIVICPKEGRNVLEPNYMVEIEKPNRETLKLLIEKVGGGISGVRLERDIKPKKPSDIVNEFLKALYIE